VHLIAPFIRDAELRSLTPVLGAAMVDDMRNIRTSDPCNYNEAIGAISKAFPVESAQSIAYESLWTEHLFEFLALATLWLALPSIRTQTQSGGLIHLADHNAARAAKEEADQLIKHYDQILQYRAKDMQNWICQRLTDYPLFAKENCESCDKKQSNAYTHILLY
jgi:succinate dehydrogenase flavin-adding protein (antitoxin of CptAB toxin-antitoxin module)